jgi:hypothetical protein
MKSFIPVKTAKALLTISRRDRHFSPRLKALLISIDGKRTIPSLKKYIAEDDDAKLAAMLYELQEAGLIEYAEDLTTAAVLNTIVKNQYIELLKETNDSQPAPPSAPLTTAPQKPTIRTEAASSKTDRKANDLSQQQVPKPSQVEGADLYKLDLLKEELKEFLQPLMGDDYSLVARKIASCDSTERLATMLRGFEDIIQNYGSRKSAEQFKSKFSEFY